MDVMTLKWAKRWIHVGREAPGAGAELGNVGDADF